MKKSTKRYFFSFHAFILIFLVVGIYLAVRQARPIFISMLFAVGIILNLLLIVVFIMDVQQQNIPEREKVVWSLLLVFIWPTIWIFAIWSATRLKRQPG
jgi:cytochrome bd-type quinol oxidase subunit 1